MLVELTLLGGIVENGNLELKPNKIYGGISCEGWVIQGSLESSLGLKQVAVKQFYDETSDDRGVSITQDPVKKVNESFYAFEVMGDLGFRTIPFYAKATCENDWAYLILEDLTLRGEVIDEKWTHRSRVHRQKIKKSNNFKELELEMLRNTLLQRIYNVGLGNGVSKMFVLDSENNSDFFITDVGEYERKRDEFVDLSNPFDVYASLIGDVERARDTWNKETKSLEFELKKLMCQATLNSIKYDSGTCFSNLEFSKNAFERIDYSRKVLQSKFNFYTLALSQRGLDDELLFSNLDYDVLRGGNERELMDLALLKTMDRNISNNLGLNVRNEGFSFLEDKLPESLVVDVYCNSGRSELVLKVEVPYNDSFKAAGCGDYSGEFDVSQVVGMERIVRAVDRENIGDFDFDKLQVFNFAGTDGLAYGKEIIYYFK